MTRRVSDQSTQSPLTALLEQSFSALIRQCMFTLPGRVTGFDPETQLAQIEWGINRVDEDGNALPTPVVDNVPVVFSGDGEWYFWHQITPGDTEGLIHFSQRAIDTWIEQGGPATPHERRYLSEEDAFFVPGFRSKPGAIPNFRNDGAGISNYDQSSYTHYKSDGTIETVTDSAVTVEAGGNIEATTQADLTATVTGNATADVTGNATVTASAITLNGPVQINGTLTTTGAIAGGAGGTFTNDVTAQGISVATHTHTQPADSAGDSESPTNPPQ